MYMKNVYEELELICICKILRELITHDVCAIKSF